jgi:hypothetical protein
MIGASSVPARAASRPEEGTGAAIDELRIVLRISDAVMARSLFARGFEKQFTRVFEKREAKRTGAGAGGVLASSK